MMGPVTYTVTGASTTSGPVQLDYNKFTGLQIQAVVSSLPTYNIEWTNDPPSSISTSATMNWFSSGLSGLTSHAMVNIYFPIRCLRTNITAGTTICTVTTTIIQSQA